jgi:O-antigen ligase
MAHPLATRPAAEGAPLAVAAVAAGMAVATFAAAVPGWGGALSLLWLVLAVTSSRWPVAGLAIIALAVPFEQRLAIPTVVGDITAMEYTVWACVVGMAPGLLKSRHLRIDRVAVMHIAIVVALIASIASGGVRLASWWDVIHGWLLALLVYVVARSLPLAVRDRLLIVSALAVGVIINLGMAVWQRASDAGPESFVVGGALRVFGTFFHPNNLAAYLAFVLPVLLAVSLVRRTPAAWLARFAAVAGVIALVMTQSRGGLLALSAALVVLVLLAPRSIQRWLVVCSLAAALLLTASGAIDRLPGLDRFSAILVEGEPTQVTPETWGQREREAHWGAAWSMLRSEPVFGVGAGEFNDRFREYTPEWRFRVGRGHAHNGYLQLGAEAGVPGLLAFVGWVGTIVVVLWRRVIATSGIDYLLAAGALGTAVAWGLNNVFEYQDVRSNLVMFTLLVALGLGGTGATSAPVTRGDAIGDAP